MKKLLLTGKTLLCKKADYAQNTWTQKVNSGGAARHKATGFSIGSHGYITFMSSLKVLLIIALTVASLYATAQQGNCLSFAPVVTYGSGGAPWDVATGDFNEDGKTDLAVANSDQNTVGVLLGKGDGTFAAAE